MHAVASQPENSWWFIFPVAVSHTGYMLVAIDILLILPLENGCLIYAVLVEIVKLLGPRTHLNGRYKCESQSRIRMIVNVGWMEYTFHEFLACILLEECLMLNWRPQIADHEVQNRLELMLLITWVVYKRCILTWSANVLAWFLFIAYPFSFTQSYPCQVHSCRCNLTRLVIDEPMVQATDF